MSTLAQKSPAAIGKNGEVFPQVRLQTVKRAETRARRIAGFVQMLARGETLHPQPARKPR